MEKGALRVSTASVPTLALLLPAAGSAEYNPVTDHQIST
jgi:hypothetical protein